MVTTNALTYGGASYWAALAALCAAVVSLAQRFPIAAAQGTRVRAAAQLSAHVAPMTHVVRKTDGRVPPRGRRL